MGREIGDNEREIAECASSITQKLQSLSINSNMSDQPQPDTSKMTPEEKAHFDKFGMLPKKSLATHMLGKRDEGRQHFDSAEWAKGLQNKKGPLGKVQND